LPTTDNGTFIVYGRIFDKDGGYTDYQSTVAVINVAPANVALSLSAASISEGQSVTVGGTFTDPGVLDTHAVCISWGDGSPGLMVPLGPGELSFGGLSHQYLDNPTGPPNGNFSIGVIVTDKDGESGGGAASVQIKNVAPSGQGDADTLDASGSTANNAFFGGDGNDNLLAGSGRNLMVGGGGSDKISAINAGDSILIGGTTDYDLENPALTYYKKLAAVYAIMAEWGRTDLTGTTLQQYQTRVTHLTSGGGLNGTWLLNAITMHDGAANTLTGCGGLRLVRRRPGQPGLPQELAYRRSDHQCVLISRDDARARVLTTAGQHGRIPNGLRRIAEVTARNHISVHM
jgi:hypothetical protein